MRSLQLVITSIVTFLLVFEAHAEEPKISTSFVSGLIEQPIISSIYRDKIGLLWIGTQEGLYRFDGTKVTIFNSEKTNKNWISSSHVRGIIEAPNGNMIIAALDGDIIEITRTSGDIETIIRLNSNISLFQETNGGRVWITSDDKIFSYNQALRKATPWASIPKMQGEAGEIYALLESSSRDLYVGSNLGLSIVDSEGTVSKTIGIDKLGLPDFAKVSALAFDPSGNLIVGSSTGHITILNSVTHKLIEQRKIEGITPKYISEFLLYKNSLLVGTDKGLLRTDHNLSNFEDLSSKGRGLTNTDISNIYEDSGDIWIGTYNGLNILSFTPFDFFNSNNSGIFDDVTSFAEDSQGRIWIGTYNGLYSFNSIEGTHTKMELWPTQKFQSGQKVTAIEAKGDELWVGFYESGIQIMTPENALSTTPLPTNLSVTKILSSRNNLDMWIATYDKGLIRINGEDTTYYYENGTLPEKRVTLVAETRSEDIFSLSGSRVYRYNSESDTFTHIEFDFGLVGKNPTIYALAEDSNGSIWLGTKGQGLFRWNKVKQDSGESDLERVTEGNLDSLTIYDIVFDDSGNTWCSTQYGIIRLTPKGELSGRFLVADGLQGNDFSLGAALKSGDGHIYFGGPNGYNRFNPAEVEIDLTPPKILLTGIEFPGNSMPGNIPSELVDSLTLSHNDHFITFQYSVLDFVDPTKNQYRYKLENFDSEWIDNGPRNSSKYTALPPGDYIFRVQGANSAGIWNTDGLSLNLSVLPPPWKTWWAYSIYLVIILFLIWCLFRAVFSFAMQKESQRRNRALFEAEERAADDLQEQLELQDELIRSAHRHNRDILSQIQNFVDIPSADEAQANDKAGQRISALTFLEDCLFYHAGGPVADLHKYTELLVPHLLQHASIKPETVVTINEVTPGLVDADLALPLSVVIFEILDNCLKHAFDAESPANYIQIKLSSKPDEMSIRTIWTFIIRDSGKGIPSEKLALKDSEGGLYLVNSIIKKLNGEIATNNENGTRISIIIPHVEAA